MLICKWERLPDSMRTDAVRPYYEKLKKKTAGLIFKRVFDILVSLTLLILLIPVFLILAVAIKIDSRGPVFYRQVRVTQYGRTFRIHKFRSMRLGADREGTLVTVGEDERITRVGRFIRKCRLDEISQLIDVLSGNMTFVGVRPEVPEYVASYTDEMMATLLLPAGVTNLACIYFADEAKLLDGADDPDRVYIENVLPRKMKWNLAGLLRFSFFGDIGIMIKTFLAMCGVNYPEPEETAKTQETANEKGNEQE